MILDFPEYNSIFGDTDIILTYNGPLWSDGIYGMAEMFKQYLDLDGRPSNNSRAIFAVFIEQLNNMMMHSAERIRINHPDGEFSESPKGSFVLATQNDSYVMQAGNLVTEENAKTLVERIDHLNSMDKKELFNRYRELAMSEDSNPETRGAGIGLTEIALRSISKIEYNLTPQEDGKQYFIMYVTV